ncbi:MAG: hypothetical protein R2764_21790 [Bacteroidales bacterium]
MRGSLFAFLVFVFSFSLISETIIAQETRKINYFNNTGFSWLSGVGTINGFTSFKDNNESNWSLSTINGIKHKSSVFGAGLGYEQWHDSFIIPAFFRYQFFIKDVKPSLYEYFDIGYSFGSMKKQASSQPEEKGRMLISIGLGINIKVNEMSYVSISTFYKLQRAMIEGYKVDYTTNYHFIGIAIGVSFY